MKPEELLVHSEFLNILARALVVDENLASDITQETWLSAIKNPPSTGKNIKAWLSKVMRNAVRMSARSESRRKSREQSIDRDIDIPSPQEIAEQEETRRIVVDALLSLDEPYRSAIVLRYYKDLPHKEAAKRLGVPIETMRTRLKRGMEQLKQRLDKSHDGNRRSWLVALAPFCGASLTSSTAKASPIFAGVLAMSLKAKILSVSIFVICSLILLVKFTPLFSTDEKNTPDPIQEQVAIVDEDTAPEDSTLEEGLREPLIAKGSDGLTGELTDIKATKTSTSIDGQFLEFKTGIPVQGVTVIRSGPESTVIAVSGADGFFKGDIDIDPPNSSMPGLYYFEKMGYIKKQTNTIMAFKGKTLHLGTQILTPGCVLSGKVLDELGNPARRANVTFTQGDGLIFFTKDKRRFGPDYKNVKERTTTDENGKFLFQGVPKGYGRVWATSNSKPYLYTFTDQIKVRINDEKSDVELKLTPLDRDQYLEGIVLSPDGAPVPEITIKRFNIKSNGGLTNGSWMETDSKGKFFIERSKYDPEGANYQLSAEDPQARFGPSLKKVASLKDENVTLHLTKLQTVVLSITVENAEPPDTFIVAVLPSSERRFLEAPKSYRFQGPNDELKIPLPLDPFTLAVDAEGFILAELGPFDPAVLTNTIEVVLKPLAGIKGIVVINGTPEPDVRVSLLEATEEGVMRKAGEFLIRVNPKRVAQAVTDEKGAFDLSLRKSGLFYLHAEKKGAAPADLGPIEIDWERGIKDIVVSLGVGGAISGRIISDRGVSPAGLIVGASRGDGYPQSIRVGDDGAYLFENLIPGKWQVQLTGADFSGDGRFYGSTWTDLKGPIPWNCIVAENETTVFNISLTPPENGAINGKLIINNEAPESWTASLKRKGGSIMSTPLSNSAIDSEGYFVLNHQVSGPYLLELYGSIVGGGKIVIKENVTLQPGKSTPWSLDLSTGKVMVRGIPAAMEKITISGFTVPQFAYRWKGKGGLTLLAELRKSTDASALIATAPAGDGTVIRIIPATDSPQGYKEKAIVDVNITAGETEEVEITISK